MPALSLIPAAAALCAVIAVSWAYPPVPQTHDEFSYLLAADTFSRGRLANPPHPMWVHFESPHVLQQPRYVSKYPPAQGAVLAVGVALGDPVRGVWLSFALACAALAWMLRAWLPPGWALLGALAVALHPQIAALWGAGFWGGAAALGAGALVYGAAPRLVARPRARDALWLGLGVGGLALCRPYEGLVACLPAAALLARGLLRADPLGRRDLARCLALPAAAPVAAAALFLALYNARTTGSPWTLPYAVYNQTYAAVPDFLFLPRGELPGYRHPVLREFHSGDGYQSRSYTTRQSAAGFAAGLLEKLRVYWSFYCGVALSLALVALPRAIARPGVRFALGAGALFAGALAVETYEQRHYAAPFLPLGAFLLAACLRELWRFSPRGRRAGRALVPLLLLAAFVEHAAAARAHLERRSHGPLVARPGLVRQLEALGGRHLVLVRYAPDHVVHTEWVYNGAEIDGQTVVFAREMSDLARNRELLRYFSDRRAWLLEPDDWGRPLRPYAP